ncbi:hypothetical protein COT72_04995 [archaeon CG10_big_fil_rev_8_21_14_0_10_43_11]|nr:MAG: hypothetical protein COT72_04995 [archaeon CG10_big_fil_rev_8_21_14_0_10_43_11]
MKNNYELLKEKLPEIVEFVKQLPENLQEKSLEMLLLSLFEGNIKKESSEPIILPERSQDIKQINKLGYKTDSGEFHFLLRNISNLKAKNGIDAIKRLIYVLIRIYTQVMDVETISRKDIINPELKNWRLYHGSSYDFLANDRGILKNNDNYSLDKTAEIEADEFISEVLNDSIEQGWVPSSKRKSNKKLGKKTEDG